MDRQPWVHHFALVISSPQQQVTSSISRWSLSIRRRITNLLNRKIMNSNQIIESINAGIYSKNVSYTAPFSKGAYLAFVAEWKEAYKKLSASIRAQRLLFRNAQRVAAGKESRFTPEQEKELIAASKFQMPSSIGFVQITPPRYGAVHFMLVLRKLMKIEADKSYQASKETSGQPEEKALSQSITKPNLR